MNVELGSPDGVYELPNTISVDIQSSGGDVINTITAKLTSKMNDPRITAVYEYSTWANLGEKLIFVPLDSRYVLQILFFLIM